MRGADEVGKGNVIGQPFPPDKGSRGMEGTNVAFLMPKSWMSGIKKKGSRAGFKRGSPTIIILMEQRIRRCLTFHAGAARSSCFTPACSRNRGHSATIIWHCNPDPSREVTVCLHKMSARPKRCCGSRHPSICERISGADRGSRSKKGCVMRSGSRRFQGRRQAHPCRSQLPAR